MGTWKCPASPSQKTLDCWNREYIWQPHEKLQVPDTIQVTHCRSWKILKLCLLGHTQVLHSLSMWWKISTSKWWSAPSVLPMSCHVQHDPGVLLVALYDSENSQILILRAKPQLFEVYLAKRRIISSVWISFFCFKFSLLALIWLI